MPYDPERHGPRRIVGPGFHEQVHAVVQRIPRGRVATYGDVASQLGSKQVARHVGFALAALPPDRTEVPWHRVVNGRGRLSDRGPGGAADSEQALRLRQEGIQVDPRGALVDFRTVRHRFAGPWAEEEEPS